MGPSSQDPIREIGESHYHNIFKSVFSHHDTTNLLSTNGIKIINHPNSCKLKKPKSLQQLTMNVI